MIIRASNLNEQMLEEDELEALRALEDQSTNFRDPLDKVADDPEIVEMEDDELEALKIIEGQETDSSDDEIEDPELFETIEGESEEIEEILEPLSDSPQEMEYPEELKRRNISNPIRPDSSSLSISGTVSQATESVINGLAGLAIGGVSGILKSTSNGCSFLAQKAKKMDFNKLSHPISKWIDSGLDRWRKFESSAAQGKVNDKIKDIEGLINDICRNPDVANMLDRIENKDISIEDARNNISEKHGFDNPDKIPSPLKKSYNQLMETINAVANNDFIDTHAKSAVIDEKTAQALSESADKLSSLSKNPVFNILPKGSSEEIGSMQKKIEEVVEALREMISKLLKALTGSQDEDVSHQEPVQSMKG